MHRLRKIDCIMYRVTDLDRAANFYQHALGLRRAWRDDSRQMIGLVLAESDTEIVLHTDPSLPNPDMSFLVDDVVQFCSEYQQAGYRVIVPPFDVRCGKYAILSDPDGNTIAIIDLSTFGGVPQYET
jgi:predicted enzyme related to lactoylglutathione lyase